MSNLRTRAIQWQEDAAFAYEQSLKAQEVDNQEFALLYQQIGSFNYGISRGLLDIEPERIHPKWKE